MPESVSVASGGTGVTYPGGKNAAGVYQRIINHMPPHDIYIEAFLGSGAVMRNKRPARQNVGIDLSRDALDLCRDLAGADGNDFTLLEGDAIKLLPSLGMTLSDSPRSPLKSSRTLIYVDPPYMAETRKGGDLYAHELDDKAHKRLIALLKSATCMVMISGYRSALYEAELSQFHRIDYMAQTRRGMVEESLWMNFAPPVALHDYSHLGGNYRERERIKRKKARWAAKIEKMDRQERLAVMDVLTTIE